MSQTNPKKIIVFDLSRMVTYLERCLPGGIERVDINYLNALLNDDRFRIQGAFEFIQRDINYVVGISDGLTQKIHQHLYGKWILGKSADEPFIEKGKRLKEELSREVKGRRIVASKRLDESLLKLVGNGQAPVYLNCHFINIPDGDKHKEVIAASGFSPAYVVHDLISIEFPEYSYTTDMGRGHLKRLNAAGQLNARIIAISDHVKHKVRDVADTLGFKNLRITVNRNGVDERFIRPAGRTHTVKNQFVFVSTLEPRKNHALLLNVWKKIINSGLPDNEIPRLLFFGRRGWGAQNVFDMLDRSAALARYVIENNKGTDEEIVCAIQESKAMLFPSFDEGWGLPIVEALALGTPVICSDLPVHRECTQGLAHYLDPIDGLGWHQTIMDVSRGHQALSAQGFQPIRWKDAAQGLADIVAEID
jgi:glycosyltransferase involved in cell wall biosynthesis